MRRNADQNRDLDSHAQKPLTAGTRTHAGRLLLRSNPSGERSFAPAARAHAFVGSSPSAPSCRSFYWSAPLMDASVFGIARGVPHLPHFPRGRGIDRVKTTAPPKEKALAIR